jgi:transposase
MQGKWLTKYPEVDLLSGPHEDMAKERPPLRRENEVLRAERDLLKKAMAFLAK